MQKHIIVIFFTFWLPLTAYGETPKENVINLDDMKPPRRIENVYSGECNGSYFQVAWQPNPNKSILAWYSVNNKKMNASEINLFLDTNKEKGFVSDVDLVSCASTDNAAEAVFRLSLLRLRVDTPEQNFVKMIVSEDGKISLKID